MALALAGAAAVVFPQPVACQWTERVKVPHEAYMVEGAPSALVHAPAHFDPGRPLHLVVFLHGLTGCAEVLMGRGQIACRAGEPLQTGWDLAGVHDAAGQNTLLVVTQLAYMRRDRRAGRFSQEGCFTTFLNETLAALPIQRLGGRKTLADIASITLAAHSAGYYAAAAIIRRGALPPTLIHNVILLDALYNKTDDFLSWITLANTRARLVSLHLGVGAPARNSALLLRRARRTLGATRATELKDTIDEFAFAGALRDHRAVIARVKGPHQKVPDAYLAMILRALELPSAEPRLKFTSNRPGYLLSR